MADGDGQTAPAGSVLARPLTVEVRDAAGAPVKSTVVVFRVTSGIADGAGIDDTLSVTDATGRAEAALRLGTRAGEISVRAFPFGSADHAVTFTATATAGAAISGFLPGSVGPGDTLAIAGSLLGGMAATVEFGGTRVRPVSGSDAEVRVVVPDCLPPGNVTVRVLRGTAWTASRTLNYSSRRRPLTLRPYEAVVIDAGELSSCATLAVEAAEEYVVIPQLAARADSPVSTLVRVTVAGVTAGGVTAASLFGQSAESPLARTARPRAQQELDVRLRDAERRLAPTARGGEPYQPPMLALTLGSLRTFDVITTLEATEFTKATGKLRFIGEHIGIFVDTSAFPSYADADLARLGSLFDTELYPTVVASFGPESDIDRNGKVLVFLTPRVNALVAANDCGQRGFVTGFFYGRDLLPSLPHSNAGEIFYALVPDPYANYSCAHAFNDTQRLVSGTFIHEMQHMISYFHHVVARGGESEEPWLNEGLSHIAEELASRVFEARYPPPLGRTTAEQIFPDSSQPFIATQLLNSYVYLYFSASHSVTTFVGSGSLEERGAAWLFLRWLGDQKGDGIYGRLVQTSQTGIANVEARTGEKFATLFGDFSVAIWADSMPGVPRAQVPARYRFHSRNLRQLMARQALIAGWEDPFPVKPIHIPVGGYAEGPLMPGTMVYGALGPFAPGQGGVVLGFAKKDGSGFGLSEGAQLGILRVK
ncbi:MAG: hypothetical protein Q8K55_05165 [Gemmatimonadaceae bacterium]|nr:hypothetical protein [Gemmatimonadaceae bacterium]